MDTSDPALVAAYKMLLDQDPHLTSINEALRSQDYMIVKIHLYEYLWSQIDAAHRPTEAIKAKARSRKSNAAKDKAKTKRGEE
jgi:hypothetical protein